MKNQINAGHTADAHKSNVEQKSMKNEIIVNDHIWSLKNQELYSHYEYRSWWWGLNADGVDIYILKGGFGFNLYFGSYSNIYIDITDFYAIWHTFKSGNITDYDYIEQCIIIADNICVALEKAGLLKYARKSKTY